MFLQGVIMLKNSMFILYLFATTIILSTNDSFAGHFSKDEVQEGDLSFKEAKLQYKGASSSGPPHENF